MMSMNNNIKNNNKNKNNYESNVAKNKKTFKNCRFEREKTRNISLMLTYKF